MLYWKAPDISDGKPAGVCATKERYEWHPGKTSRGLFWVLPLKYDDDKTNSQFFEAMVHHYFAADCMGFGVMDGDMEHVPSAYAVESMRHFLVYA